jgi:type II secretion system protein H
MRRYQSQNSAGFTLLEALVVLAVVVLSVSVALQATPRQNPRLDLERAALELTAVMRSAQLKALKDQEKTTFTLDLANRRFWSAKDRLHQLDSETEVTMLSARGSRPATELGEVKFLPNGQNTGTTIRLSQGDYSAEITADWLTGAINVRMLE